MMDDSLSSASQAIAFRVFQRVCVPIIQSPSVETVKRLQLTIEEYFSASTLPVDGESLNVSPLLDYIALPLLVILKNPKK